MKIVGKGIDLPVSLLGYSDGSPVIVHFRNIAYYFKGLKEVSSAVSEGKNWLLIAEDWSGLKLHYPIWFELDGKDCSLEELKAIINKAQVNKLEIPFARPGDMTEIEHYLSLEYPITLVRDYLGNGFVASIIPLGDCVAKGHTIEEALANLENRKQIWIKDAYRSGNYIPLPNDNRKH